MGRSPKPAGYRRRISRPRDMPICCSSLHYADATCPGVSPYPCSPGPLRPVPDETTRRPSHLPGSNPCLRLRDELGTIFRHHVCADLYPRRGQPRLPRGGRRWPPSCNSARTSPTARPPTLSGGGDRLQPGLRSAWREGEPRVSWSLLVNEGSIGQNRESGGFRITWRPRDFWLLWKSLRFSRTLRLEAAESTVPRSVVEQSS
jgi:hypothetical protein